MEEKEQGHCVICGVGVQEVLKCYECTIMFWDSLDDVYEAEKRNNNAQYSSRDNL